jgi:hypothetical protein
VLCSKRWLPLDAGHLLQLSSEDEFVSAVSHVLLLAFWGL